VHQKLIGKATLNKAKEKYLHKAPFLTKLPIHFRHDLNTDAILDVDLANLKITGIHLALTASLIDGLSADTFQQIAEGAKANCIVSQALSVPITLSVSYQ
jgi:organic hydroperoxide reductase OsmC/OhrA